MELIHENSREVDKSEIADIFSVLGTQTNITNGHWIVINPSQSLDDATVVSFTAPAGKFWTDLANSFITIRFSVSKMAEHNRVAIVAGDALSLTNLIAHSLWSKINLNVSGKDITDDNSIPVCCLHS